MCLVRFSCDNLAHTSIGKNQVSEDLAELGCFLDSSFVLLLAFVALLVLHLHWEFSLALWSRTWAVERIREKKSSYDIPPWLPYCFALFFYPLIADYSAILRNNHEI